MRRTLLIIPMLFFIVTNGCASSESEYWPKLEGRVLDAATGKPIEDVIVVARWKGISGYTNTVCYHVESTTTDKQGRYEIPAWRNDTRFQSLLNENVVITTFKAGYEESDRIYKEHSYKQGVYYQQTFNGSHEERLEYLMRVSSATRCGEADTTESNLIPLKQSLYDEATRIAETPEDMGKVESLLFGLESLKVGSMEALKIINERKQNKNEHNR